MIKMEMETFIDRIEGNKVILMDEEDREAIVPSEWIPNAHEGAAVTLVITEDPKREAAAREEAAKLLKELQEGK